METEQTQTEQYRNGYNPDFIKRVYEKRRQLERELEREQLQKRNKWFAEYQAKKAALNAESEKLDEILKKLDDRITVTRYEVKHKRRLLGKGDPLTTITCAKIIEMVAACHGLEPEILAGDKRNKVIVAARHDAIVAAWIIREDMSSTEIGRQFGRDHTTILHAVQRRGWKNGTWANDWPLFSIPDVDDWVRCMLAEQKK